MRMLFLVLWLLLPATARAADDRWVQRHYASTDGLPVSSVATARIDVNGFLWLATHDGLARFDGQRFEIYDSARLPTMGGNRIVSLHQDEQQRIYAREARGAWLRVESNGITPVFAVGDETMTVRHVDAASRCVTLARGLHCPDGQGGYVRTVEFPAALKPAMAVPASGSTTWLVDDQGAIWHHADGRWRMHWQGQSHDSLRTWPRLAVTDADGALWLATERGLLMLQPELSAPRLWSAQEGINGVHHLRIEPDGGIWVGTDAAMYRIQQAVIASVWARPNADGDAIHRSWRGPDDALWFSADGDLYRCGGEQVLAVACTEPLLRSSGTIADLLFDAEGTVWVTTLRDGLYALSRPRVKLLDAEAGLAGVNFYGVSVAPDNTVWTGSLGAGLHSIAADGQIRRYGVEQGLPGPNTWVVAAAANGDVYAAGYAPGLFRKAVDASDFAPVSLPEALAGASILAIAFDSDQQLALGTSAGAWRRSDGRWHRLWPASDASVQVNALLWDSQQVLWLASAEGLQRLSSVADPNVASTVLRDYPIRGLYLDHAGWLWLSTGGRGLLRIDPRHPEAPALRLGRAEGLPSNSPHAVLEDAERSLWINSNQGVFRITRQGLDEFLAGRIDRLSPLALGLSDGVSELEGNGGVQPVATTDALGRLWFPSQAGLIRIDPQAMSLRTKAPQALIDAFESGGGARPLTPLVELPVGLRSVLVRYGAADLHAGSRLRFRYRLLPSEGHWIDSSNARTASFAALAPGDYRFELIAGNSDGFWSDAPARLDFRVAPYWHETDSVRIVAVVSGAVILLLLVQLRSHRLRERARELDLQVQSRTAELLSEKSLVERTLHDLAEAHRDLASTHRQIEQRNLKLAEQALRLEALDGFRARLLADVSHEMRTPLMLVSLPLRELVDASSGLRDNERRRAELALRQAGRLEGLVGQLVDLVQAESGQLRVQFARFELVGFLQEMVSAYRPGLTQARVSLRLVAPPTGLIMFADRAHLTTVLGNLIDNAGKYSPTGSEIRIGIHVDSDFERVRVSVTDQGIGFEPALTEQLFERFFRAEGPPRNGREGLGIGLALARELVELHGGRIGARSQPGQGAEFWFELPLGSAHVALEELTLADAPAQQSQIAATRSPVDTVEGKPLLLVEDHPDLAAYLCERLSEHLPVQWASDAEQAWRLLERESYAMLVCDVLLPGASGVDLCRRLTSDQRFLSVPVLLVSAKAGESDRDSGLAAGAVAYLAKPFSFATLLREIRRHIPGQFAAAPAAAKARAGRGLPTDDPVLRTALSLLSDSDFTVSAWAARLHISDRQLRRKVVDATGSSPLPWLREQRLQRVRALVSNGECKTLMEAGSRSGMDNPAYLYRIYRARFGDADD